MKQLPMAAMAGSRDSQFSTKADAGENTQIGKVCFQAPPSKAAPARIGRLTTLPIPAIRTTTSQRWSMMLFASHFGSGYPNSKTGIEYSTHRP